MSQRKEMQKADVYSFIYDCCFVYVSFSSVLSFILADILWFNIFIGLKTESIETQQIYLTNLALEIIK